MEALTRVSIQIFSSYHSTPNNVDYSITLQSCSSNLSDFIFRENGTKAWHSLSKRKHKPTWGAHGVNALCRMHIAEQSCQTWQSAKQSYKEPETEPHYVFLSTPQLKVNQAFFVLKKNLGTNWHEIYMQQIHGERPHAAMHGFSCRTISVPPLIWKPELRCKRKHSLSCTHVKKKTKTNSQAKTNTINQGCLTRHRWGDNWISRAL